MRKIKIFVSSVISEFKTERTRLKEFIEEKNKVFAEKLGVLLDAFFSENSGPETRTSFELCISKVKECDIFICIIGKKYGQPVWDGLSPTHKEYRTAYECLERSKGERPEILVFVKDIDPNKDVRETGVEGLISEIRERHHYRKFRNSNELIKLVENKLLEAIFDRIAGGEADFKSMFCDKLKECVDSLRNRDGTFERRVDEIISIIKREIDD